MSEMLEILSTLHEMEGAPTDKIQTMATSMFSKATENFNNSWKIFEILTKTDYLVQMEVGEDQELTKDQFISACLMDENLLELLRGEEERGGGGGG